ncbi:MAG: hypothetical protein GY910_04020 [bacterium]|nr:hypothetical protein [bacterium]
MRYRAQFLVVPFFLALSPSLAQAATDLGVCAPNGVTVSTDVTVRYNGVGAGAADQLSDSDSKVVSPNAGPFADTANSAALLLPPGGGDPKDRVNGAMSSYFEFGTPVGSTALDTLQLEANGAASTVNALNSAGNLAGAEVTGEARAEFFIDIVAGTDCDTFFNIPAMRALEPFETLLEINVIRDPGGAGEVLATLSPGSPAATILLPEDNFFLIQLNYDYALPHGIDPPFGYSFVSSFGVSPAPVLGTGGMIALGLVALALGTVVLRVPRKGLIR